MSKGNGIADMLEYGRRLLQASIDGLHSEEQLLREAGGTDLLAASACSAVKAAASARLANRASREIAKVRNQHWLETNPIDYA